MIKQIRNPPTNVSKYAVINSFFFLAFVVFAAQLEKSGMASPDGYASLPTIIGTIIFLFASLMLELFIVMSIIVAARWRLAMPDYLAIGILKGEQET